MNKFLKSWQLIALSVLLFGAVACNDDDKPDKPISNDAKFLIETTVKNPDGATGSDYLQLVSKFSGKVDNANAYQMLFYSIVTVEGQNVYEFPEYMGASGVSLNKHFYTGEKLLLKGSLTLPANAGAMNLTIVNENKAYIPLYNMGLVWVINPKTMEKIGEIKLNEYAYSDQNPEPAMGIMRGDFYYLPLSQIGANYMPYDDYQQSDVLVIDAKTDKVVKIISEKITGLTFPTRPMGTGRGLIFIDEQNNIYIACLGYSGYNPNNTKTGFICIPNGKTEFDTSKSWDISNTLIEGTSYKPVSIYNTKYIGNGKVLAYVYIAELAGDNPYTSKNLMAVICNLKTKTIKKIDGMPLSDGFSMAINQYKDKYVFSVCGKEKTGFYTYNPQTGEVQLALETVGNPVCFHYFE